MNGKKKGLGAFLALIFVALGAVAQDQDADSDDGVRQTLEEILVTAQKRGEQPISDLAFSMTAVSKEEIQARGLVGLGDLLLGEPSVNFNDANPGSNQIVFRGLTTDNGRNTDNPLVGVYIGDTLVSGLGVFGGGTPDLKYVDIERIELLRGPQGTLYGDTSMSGTLRIIPSKPIFNEFSGNVAASLSYTDKANEANTVVQATLNIPVAEDKLALRVVLYNYENAGYYENVAGSDPVKLAQQAAIGGELPSGPSGDSSYTGGRITALWEPTDTLAITLMHITQDVDQNGRNVDDEFGRFKQSRWGGEESSIDLDITSLSIEYDLGVATITSATSWSGVSARLNDEFGFFGYFLGLGGDAPVFLDSNDDFDVFSEELRVVTNLPGKINLVAGLYYWRRENDRDWDLNFDGNPASHPFGGAPIVGQTLNVDMEQTAAFGEISYDINDYLTATLGIRYFKYDVSTRSSGRGSGIFASSGEITRLSSGEDGTTHKVNIAYRPNDDSLFYGQFSQGFRLGKPFQVWDPCDLDGDGIFDGTTIPIQDQINSDTVDAWELGAKQTFFNGRLEANVAAFRSDWKDLPVTFVVAACGANQTVNAAAAKSTGVELHGTFLLTDNILFYYSGSYNKAEIAEDAPLLGFFDGDRLPYSPKYNASVSAQYSFTLRNNQDAFLRADVTYVGEYFSTVGGSELDGPKLGDYFAINMMSGVIFGNTQIRLYVQNILNDDGLSAIFSSTEGVRYRPRQAGVELRYFF